MGGNGISIHPGNQQATAAIAGRRIKKVTIRENRYPFLSKIEEWNKDVNKSGDTLVEKCCHFFDLFRLITGQEMDSCVSKIHRGLLWDHYGYQDQDDEDVVPIIDSAYVLLDFVQTKGVDAMINLTSTDSVETVEQHQPSPPKRRAVQQSTIVCSPRDHVIRKKLLLLE